MTCRVAVFFLGGTISMAGSAGGAVVRAGAAELIAAVPGLDALDVELEPQDVCKIPSASLRFADVLDLLRQAEAARPDGVVIVQGTDSLEEAAFLVDLLWPHDSPVVLTGAMRNPTMAGADGPANLLAAITVAASQAWRGLGALVVMNDEIHAARHVAKRHTSSPAAFASPNAGALGRLVEGTPVLAAAVSRRAVLPMPEAMSAHVPIVVMSLGDDGSLLDGIEDRCDGLVVAGFGVGHVPERLVGRIAEIATVRPVVLASRIGAGPVLRSTYGAPGSERDLLGRGLIGAGLLTAYQARLLLAVLLTNGGDVRASFAAYG